MTKTKTQRKRETLKRIEALRLKVHGLQARDDDSKGDKIRVAQLEDEMQRLQMTMVE